MPRPLVLASAIVRGLIATQRAEPQRCRVGDVVRLQCRGRAEYYWIDYRGDSLLRGPTLLDAEPLQPSFVAAMAKAGEVKYRRPPLPFAD